MKLIIITIVMDGMPWITCHYPELRRLAIPWEWHIVEGRAMPEKCTSWCNRLPPGLSSDGTSEYLDSIAFDPHVFIHRSEAWHGKVEMVNAPLRHLKERCVLLEIDSDELWTAAQIQQIHELLASGKHNCAYFACRYYLGPDIAITSRNTFGDRDYEWLRAWRIEPGQRFKSHEPPVMEGTPSPISKRDTEKYLLIFDHMAYATERQMKFKVDYYGSPQNPLGKLYAPALDGWRRLQRNADWPVKVRDYLPFVNDEATAERIRA